MGTTKIEIVLCMGSSCFARGNKKLQFVIRDYLKTLPFKDDIEFKGYHCLGHCSCGPNIKINDKTVEGVNEENIIATLEKALSEFTK
ncbi:MAG: NAD(P)H-dependent oxidoreductase subunit E [Bacteroidota bacterium]